MTVGPKLVNKEGGTNESWNNVVKRDRFVILLILGLAVTATIFAGWFRWSQGHKAQDFWGLNVSEQIRFAPQVELIWLESPRFGMRASGLSPNGSPATTGDAINIDGTDYPIRRRADITQARGLIHARQALLQDATFQWDPQTLATDSSWTHALVVRDPAKEPVTLLFDLSASNEGFVRELNTREMIQLTIPEGFRTFFSEQGDPGPNTFQ